MRKTTLVILAAGMGSRFGSLKQIEPVGPCGEVIIDYSVFDAKRAGFDKVVFVIKKAIEDEFKKALGDRLSKHIEVDYAYQELDMLPVGCVVPEGREKPWGTGHAVLCCREVVDTPFAVINADDFYGYGTFKLLHDFLVAPAQNPNKLNICMAGFALRNTLTENGSVSRGVCTLDENSFLTDIVERVRIENTQNGPAFTEDGEAWESLTEDTVVSMNCWGFPQGFLDTIEDKFKAFMGNLGGNPLKAEFYLPLCVDLLIQEQKAQTKVLPTDEKWYGITYKEDKASLTEALRRMTDEGNYPEGLWG